MAAIAVRAMTLGQNIHMIQNNCVFSSGVSPTGVTLLHHHGKRAIAPAPSDHRVNILGNINTNDLRCNNNNNNNNHNNNHNKQKRMNCSPITYGGNQPNSVARRNARERNRVKQVNNGFTNLRQHIPQDIVNTLTNGGRGASKKLSKVDTLKMAVEYIRRLQTLLDDADTDSGSTSTSTSKSMSSIQSSYYADNSMHNSLQQCSESGSSSPTPSYESESSLCNKTTYAPSVQSYTHEHEHCDSYGSMNSLDDDLLDVISSWQQE